MNDMTLVTKFEIFFLRSVLATDLNVSLDLIVFRSTNVVPDEPFLRHRDASKSV